MGKAKRRTPRDPARTAEPSAASGQVLANATTASAAIARKVNVPDEVGPGYPVWNTKKVMTIAIPVLVVITFLVYALSNRSFIVETERALIAISICLFLFIAFGLYSGVQIQNPGKDLELEQDGFRSPGVGASPDWTDVLSAMFYFTPPDLSKIEFPKIDLDGIPDGSDDLVGCLLSIVLWIVAAIVITFLVWAFAQIMAIVLPLLGVGLYWIFYRALKLVFSRSAECCKQIGPTLKYSLVYTVLFTGWLFVVLEVSKRVLG